MRVTEIFKDFFFKKQACKMVGRWHLERCAKKLDRKIELSNEDHCGPCGEYILAKAIEKTKEDSQKTSK